VNSWAVWRRGGIETICRVVDGVVASLKIEGDAKSDSYVIGTK